MTHDRTDRRGFYWLLLAAASVFNGCGAPIADELEPTQTAELSVAQQIVLGRSGQRDRIELLRTPTDDAMLEPLRSSDAWIETLILDAGILTDRGVDSIASLPRLTHLRLRQSPISDSGLARLSRCESLRILNLPQCQATAVGVATLTELPELRNLRLGGPRLASSESPGEVADALASIQSLRSLHLIGVPIDDPGLRRIASLPKLRSLYLDDSDVTQAGWDWLFEKHPHLHVHVNQKHLDRDHKAHGDHSGERLSTDHAVTEGELP